MEKDEREGKEGRGSAAVGDGENWWWRMLYANEPSKRRASAVLGGSILPLRNFFDDDAVPDDASTSSLPHRTKDLIQLTFML